jgi:cold shock protein
VIGRVKFWNARGFGFLSPDGGGGDVFIHAAELKRAALSEPREGDRFEFDTGPGRDGKLRATNLRRVAE